MHLGAFVSDDQGAFELACTVGVDPERGLQRQIDFNSWRDIDERTTRPDRSVECGELVVAGRDDRAKVLLDQVRVLAHGSVHVAEQDPLLFQVVTVFAVDDVGLVLGVGACEVLRIDPGDAKLFVCARHFFRGFVPLGNQLAQGTPVVVHVVEIDVGHVGCEPFRHRLLVEQAE